jgi:hypothetical protein
MKSVTQTKKVKVNFSVIPVFMLSFLLPFKMPNTCLYLLNINNDNQSLKDQALVQCFSISC